jgi:hypothetical protein
VRAVIHEARPPTHRIDVDQAHHVAGAFLDAPRASADPAVRAAYAALDTQANRWFERLTGPSSRRPVRIVHTRRPDPYPSAQAIAHHVRHERVLEICPAKYDRDRLHPLLDTSVGGSYDRLRAVHDIVSHAWCGYGFDRDGEYSGWLTEDRMYTGLARWALVTELHAEHSVRWTTGELAEHKAVLLPRSVVRSSRPRPR